MVVGVQVNRHLGGRIILFDGQNSIDAKERIISIFLELPVSQLGWMLVLFTTFEFGDT